MRTEKYAMNNLIEIIWPRYIKAIGYDAFCGNYLTTIDLRYGSDIGANSFSDNFIRESQINPDLQGMGLYAFGKKNTDFIVNNSKLPSKLVKRYSSKLIPKVLFIQKTLPHFNFDLTNSKVLELLPYDLKIIKAYNSNVKKVNNYLQKYSNLQSNEEPLFKLSFALGQIGRASCRERVWQCVLTSGFACSRRRKL